MNGASAPADALAEAILAAAHEAGVAAREVCGLKRLSGGASKETWAFTLLKPDGSEEALVMRREAPGRRFASQGLDSVAREAAIIRQVGSSGVPVPRVAFEMSPDSALGDGYVMSRVDGETVGGRVLKLAELASARAGMARRCGEILARIHATQPIDRLGLPKRRARDALAELDARHCATGHCRPVFEYALRWLDAHLPRESRLTLVHGDFRVGNLVVGPDGIRAVLDWELAHIGAPESDLAWLCVPSWRFQRPDLPVGGVGTREDLLAGYADAGGSDIDPEELFAWEVFQMLNWGVMCAGVANAISGTEGSVEGAVIARRASEAEFDLMRALAPQHADWGGVRHAG